MSMHETHPKELSDSEKRFRALIEHSHDGLIVLDDKGKVLEISLSARKILDFGEAQKMSSVRWDRIHHDDLEKALQTFKEVASTPNLVLTVELRIRPVADSACKWLEVTCHNLLHEPDIRGIVLNFRDITERKLATQALEASEQRWKFALEGSNQGLWDWDIESQAVFYSPGWKKLLGYNDQEISNTLEEWEKRIHPDDKKNVHRDIDIHFTSPDPNYENIYRLQDKAGNYRWILARGMIVARSASGKPLRMIGTHTDITGRVEAEQAVRRSEEKYKYLFYSNPQPMWIYELSTLRFLEVNEAAVRHYGYSAEEFRNMTIGEIRPPEDIPGMRARVDAVKMSPEISTSDLYWRHVKKNGELIFVDIKSHGIDFNGLAARLVLAHDVTEKLRAEESLRESNQRFAFAARATSDAIWDADLLKGTITWGEGFENLFGYKDKEGQNGLEAWLAHIHPDDRQEVLKTRREIIADPGAGLWTGEYRFIRADGSLAHIIDRGIIMRDRDRKAYRIVGAMQDVTERKELEASLAEQTLNRQKQITEATIQAQEKERALIGKELHDNINQVLTTTKLYIDMSLAEKEIREELLRKSYRNISKAIDEIRILSKALVPPSLGDIGLKEAIVDMLDNLYLPGTLNIRLKTTGLHKITIPDHLKLMAFRIIQEQVNNIIKHSKATDAEIKLVVSKKMLNICVSDNGIGYDPTKKTKGIGLSNISSRAELYNGQVEISTSPGKGCILKVLIPL